MRGKAHLVYHGTAMMFRADIEEKGLVPPPGHGAGVRVTMRLVRADRHARAYCAAAMLEKSQPPRGLIVRAVVHESRLREVDGVLRVTLGISPSEFCDPVTGAFRFAAPTFPELYRPDVAAEALEDYEEMTGRKLAAPFPRRRARRT